MNVKTELGKLTALAYRDGKSGRRRVLRWGPTVAPLLGYDARPRANLVIVYPVRPKGRASVSEIREYGRTHWGKSGEGERIEGLEALEPLEELGPAIEVTYTTEKGFDRAPTDYVHEFGEGSKGAFVPPIVYVHRCRLARCAFDEMIRVVGGSYRVGERGIVG